MKTEDLRHKLSAVLMDTDESHPMVCDIIIGEREAQGLSTLELPRVISAFQIPSEGIMYFNIEGIDEPIEFDDMDKDDLVTILDNLTNKKHYGTYNWR